MFIPSHCEATNNIKSLIDTNRNKIQELFGGDKLTMLQMNSYGMIAEYRHHQKLLALQKSMREKGLSFEENQSKEKKSMEEIIYKDGYLYKDVYTIIQMMGEELKEKINPQFISFLEENQDKEYISQIDSSKPLKEQALRKEVRLLLSIIYIQYFCNKEKKIELLEHDKRLLEEYNANVNTIFKTEETVTSKNEIEEKSLVVGSNESFISRIINKIKKFLNL